MSYEIGQLYEAQYVKNGLFVSDGIWQITHKKTGMCDSKNHTNLRIKKVADENECFDKRRMLMVHKIATIKKIGDRTKNRFDALSRDQFCVYFHSQKTPFIFTQINLK